MGTIKKARSFSTNIYLVGLVIFSIFNPLMSGNVRAARPEKPASSLNAALISTSYVAVAAGGIHSCGLTSTGGVKCWGYNKDGELGDGTYTDSVYPKNVSGLTSGVVAITAGERHTCALTSVGSVKCWGYNVWGQLGNGTNTNSNRPVLVSGLSSGVTAVSAGYDHTCAILSGGGLKCWGSNLFGILGNGSQIDSYRPVDVYGLGSGVTAVSAGKMHTCALVGGVAKCWGANAEGQLGNDTVDQVSIPLDVLNLGTDIKAISAGGFFSCAMTGSGGAMCWGENLYGQLGNGTNNNSRLPVNVSGLDSGVAAISAGNGHACARTPAGAMQCWGDNSYGELGNGTQINSSTPVNVSGLSSGVSAISAGRGGHTCAMTSGSVARCWGENYDGQLGNGKNINSMVPVAVTMIDPPGKFGKKSPVTGSPVDTNLTISWEPSTNVSRYEYCITRSASGNCTPWISNGTATQKYLTGLGQGYIYYWQVRAVNPTTAVYANDWSGAYWTFVTEGLAPMVTSISLLDPNPSTAANLRFKVDFSSIVTGVDIIDFQLKLMGIAGAKVLSVSGTGASYIVLVATGTGFGTLQLLVKDNDTIKNSAGRALGGPGFGDGDYLVGPKYTLDRNNRFLSIAVYDGWVLESGENSGLGGSLKADNNLAVGDNVNNRQYRSMLFFATSGIPDDATIIKVTLKIWKADLVGLAPFTTHGKLLADITPGYFGNLPNLELMDFNAAGAITAGALNLVPGTTGLYQLVLSPAYYKYVYKYGPTQVRLRFVLDDDNDSTADYVLFFAGDAFNASLRPVLIVDYLIP